MTDLYNVIENKKYLDFFFIDVTSTLHVPYNLSQVADSFEEID